MRPATSVTEAPSADTAIKAPCATVVVAGDVGAGVDPAWSRTGAADGAARSGDGARVAAPRAT
jgi:hypothetical protein